jgi:hypothetical protein
MIGRHERGDDVLELLLSGDAGEDADALLQFSRQPHQDGRTILREPAPRALGLKHEELRTGERENLADQTGGNVLGMPPPSSDLAFVNPELHAVLNEKKNLAGKVRTKVRRYPSGAGLGVGDIDHVRRRSDKAAS